MAETIDEISGGRFLLGLGAGWHLPEYQAMGLPFDYRVSRFEEALKIVTALLRTGQVDFEGRFYSARNCELRPRGPRPEGLPLMIGGGGDRVMRLAALYADAWNVDRKNDPEEVRALNAKLDAACREVGRDPRSLTRVIGVQVDVLEDRRNAFTPRQWVQSPWPIGGSSEEIAERLLAYRDAGTDQLLIALDPATPEGLEAFAPVLAEVEARL
jgi:alkanesulfonate monooxygenase SsuD/methylene tetrahydromethanopterin reductase-like flavin-dependent oxidoreductase (luciferase family)